MTDNSPSHGNDQQVVLGHSPVADVPHRLRAADTDPKAARRAERQVTSMFLLSMLFVVLFVAAYVGIDPSTTIYLPVIGDTSAINMALGICFGAGVFLIGAAAIQWAKKLMPHVEVDQQRHDQSSPEGYTDEAAAN